AGRTARPSSSPDLVAATVSSSFSASRSPAQDGRPRVPRRTNGSDFSEVPRPHHPDRVHDVAPLLPILRGRPHHLADTANTASCGKTSDEVKRRRCAGGDWGGVGEWRNKESGESNRKEDRTDKEERRGRRQSL